MPHLGQIGFSSPRRTVKPSNKRSLVHDIHRLCELLLGENMYEICSNLTSLITVSHDSVESFNGKFYWKSTVDRDVKSYFARWIWGRIVVKTELLWRWGSSQEKYACGLLNILSGYRNKHKVQNLGVSVALENIRTVFYKNNDIKLI